MKAFRFRLEKVLQLRRQMEDEQRRELSLMLFDLRQHEAKLHSFQTELASYKEEMTNALEQHELSLPRIEVFAAYLRKIGEAIESLRERIKELHRTIEVKREKLVEAIKDRKAMESVKARRWAEHHADCAREEMKFLDEIGARRHMFSEDQVRQLSNPPIGVKGYGGRS